MKINRAELATCCKFLQSISICRCSMRAPSVVAQTLYLYSSSVHILLSKSGICDVIAAVICLRNFGKVTVSECTQHIHCPNNPPSKKTQKKINPCTRSGKKECHVLHKSYQSSSLQTDSLGHTSLQGRNVEAHPSC